MKLVSFARGSRSSFGCVEGDQVLDFGPQYEPWMTLRDILPGGLHAWRATADRVAAADRYPLADLVLLDLHSPAFTPLNDVGGQLVYCESGASVALTMVDGVIVAEQGRLTRVDETALLAEARELFAAKQPALKSAHARAAEQVPAYAAMVQRAAATDVGMNRWVGGR